MANTLRKEIKELVREDDITLKELVENVGVKGYGLLFLILSIPSAMPVPAPGYSSFFSIIMLTLGFRMLIDKTPYVPKFLEEKRIKKETLEKIARYSDIYLKYLEKITKPRLNFLINEKLIAALIIFMASFMTIPYPLTNTAPSVSIFILAFSLINKDGLITILGILAGLAGATIAVLSLTLGYVFVEEAIKQIINFL
ncbi:MAG: exopolysaccharide biosynthesis protein [Patescibacteria group bacterium]